MSNMSEDIWYAGSDTRPPMLDRTDLESWQQRIRPERALESLHTFLLSKGKLPQIKTNQLKTSSNARNKATVQDDRVVVQDVRGRYNVNNQGRPFQRTVKEEMM
ncbi:hypothetical protein Tco_1554913 [Tanacetum coccineum]